MGNATTASVTGVQVAPAKSAIRDLPIAKVWAFAVGQFGWALLSGIISNWLVYFYQPDQRPSPKVRPYSCRRAWSFSAS